MMRLPSILRPVVLAALACVALAWSSPAAAQPAAPPAAAQDAAAPGDLTATVVGVEGIVQLRTAEGQPWQWAKRGDVLTAGTEVRTGPRSLIQLHIPPQQTLTLDRFGTITLLQAVREASGKIKTDVGMKYGRTAYKLQTGGIEHESTIRSPAATLAVRGSQVIFQQDAFTSYAFGDGRLIFFDALNPLGPVTFGDDGVSSTVAGDNAQPGQVERAYATADPKGQFAGRDNIESALVSERPGSAGNDQREQVQLQEMAEAAGFAAATGHVMGGGGSLPELFFNLQFNGDPNTTTVLMQVTDPNGNSISAANPAGPNAQFAGSGTADGSGFGFQLARYGDHVVPIATGMYQYTFSLTTPDSLVPYVFTISTFTPGLGGQTLHSETGNLSIGSPTVNGSIPIDAPAPGM